MSEGNLLSKMDVFGVTAGGRLRRASKMIVEGRLLAMRDLNESKSCFQETLNILRSLSPQRPDVRQSLGEALLELGHLERLRGDSPAAITALLEAESYDAPLSLGDLDFIASQFALTNRDDEPALVIYFDTICRWSNQIKPATIRPVFEILERLCLITATLDEKEAADRLELCRRVIATDSDIPFPYFYRGVHSFLGGNYSAALDEFKLAQARKSAAPELEYYLNFSAGQTARSQGDLPSSAGYFIEAVRRYPQLFPPNYEAGVCLVQLCETNAKSQSAQNTTLDIEANRRSFALKTLQRACILDENSADAWHFLGRAHYLNGDWPEATEAFERSLALDPAPEFYLAHARSLKREGRFAEATASAVKAKEIAPDNLNASRFIAKTAHQNREYPAAIREYEDLFNRAEAAGETDMAALTGLAECQYEQKRYAESIALLSPYRDALPVPLQTVLARCLSLTGDFKGAEESYALLSEQEPANGSHLYYLGTCLAHQEKYEEALDAFSRATECDSHPAGMALQRGYILETLGRTDEAEKAYRLAIEQESAEEPNSEADNRSLTETKNQNQKRTACYRLGLLAMKGKKNDDAIAWLGMAEPNLETLLALAQVHEQSGHPAAADEMYLRAIADHPDNLIPQVQFGCALARRKEWERGISVLREAIKKGDVTPASYYYLGMAYLHTEKYVNALNYLDKLPNSTALNETLCTLCLRAARQAREETQYDLAIQYWQRAIRYGGAEALLKGEIGKAYLAKGVRRAQAGEPLFQWQADILQAEKYVPHEPNLQFAMCVLDLCSARSSECLKRTESVRYLLEPHLQPCADYLIAMALLQQGDNEKAEFLFAELTALSLEKPLPFDPDYPHACLLAEQNKWEEAAKVLYSRMK